MNLETLETFCEESIKNINNINFGLDLDKYEYMNSSSYDITEEQRDLSLEELFRFLSNKVFFFYFLMDQTRKLRQRYPFADKFKISIMFLATSDKTGKDKKVYVEMGQLIRCVNLVLKRYENNEKINKNSLRKIQDTFKFMKFANIWQINAKLSELKSYVGKDGRKRKSPFVIREGAKYNNPEISNINFLNEFINIDVDCKDLTDEKLKQLEYFITKFLRCNIVYSVMSENKHASIVISTEKENRDKMKKYLKSNYDLLEKFCMDFLKISPEDNKKYIIDRNNALSFSCKNPFQDKVIISHDEFNFDENFEINSFYEDNEELYRDFNYEENLNIIKVNQNNVKKNKFNLLNRKERRTFGKIFKSKFVYDKNVDYNECVKEIEAQYNYGSKMIAGDLIYGCLGMKIPVGFRYTYINSKCLSLLNDSKINDLEFDEETVTDFLYERIDVSSGKDYYSREMIRRQVRKCVVDHAHETIEFILERRRLVHLKYKKASCGKNFQTRFMLATPEERKIMQRNSCLSKKRFTSNRTRQIAEAVLSLGLDFINNEDGFIKRGKRKFKIIINSIEELIETFSESTKSLAGVNKNSAFVNYLLEKAYELNSSLFNVRMSGEIKEVNFRKFVEHYKKDIVNYIVEKLNESKNKEKENELNNANVIVKNMFNEYIIGELIKRVYCFSKVRKEFILEKMII